MSNNHSDINIRLTETDRCILHSYSIFCEGVSAYLGSGYEIVLHSLEDCDHSAVKVINGYHTGRKEGAPITDLALSMLTRIAQTDDAARSGVTYFAANRQGEPLKSTTLPIYGEGERIIGLLCMNFYLNTPVADVLREFTKPAAGEPPAQMYETFASESEDLIMGMVKKVKAAVYDDAGVAANNKNKEIVRILNERGIFNLKDGVTKTAELLNISKNTVYLHLRNRNN